MLSIDAFMQHISALVGLSLQISKVYCGKNEMRNFSQQKNQFEKKLQERQLSSKREMFYSWEKFFSFLLDGSNIIAVQQMKLPS